MDAAVVGPCGRSYQPILLFRVKLKKVDVGGLFKESADATDATVASDAGDLMPTMPPSEAHSASLDPIRPAEEGNGLVGGKKRRITTDADAVTSSESEIQLLSDDLLSAKFNTISKSAVFYPSVDLDAIPVGADSDDEIECLTELPKKTVVAAQNSYSNVLFKTATDQEVIVERIASLAIEEDTEIIALLASYNTKKAKKSSMVIDKFNIDMTVEKYAVLHSTRWLNDEIISFFVCMMQELDNWQCSIDKSRRPSYFWSSFFRTNLREAGKYSYHRVKRWTKKIDVFALDKIFFPINVKGVHWVLAVMCMQERTITYYDSLWKDDPESNRWRFHLDDLLQWLEDESLHKKLKQLPHKAQWKLTRAEDIPEQKNGCDCGVFVLLYLILLSEGLPLNFDQADVTKFRRSAAQYIKAGKLPFTLLRDTNSNSV